MPSPPVPPSSSSSSSSSTNASSSLSSSSSRSSSSSLLPLLATETANSLCRRWHLCVALVITCLCIETLVIVTMGAHNLNTPRGIFSSTNASQKDGEGVTGSVSTVAKKTEDFTAAEFLRTYEDYCEKFLRPKPDNYQTFSNGTKMPLCQCIPDGLQGTLDVSPQAQLATPSFGDMELQHPELGVGGRWRPEPCQARSKVIVIIPFRDRESHLRIFLAHMHKILQRQQLDYRFIVVEQASPEVFNKAAMMNIGFMEAQNLGDIDCVVFHDVDMLAEDDRNFYTCSKLPRHIGAYCDKWKYTVPYPGIFGGATSFQPHHFFAVNGFSNQFYGWGGEDDDMYNRIRAQKMEIARYPGSVGKFTMIKHKSDKRNPYNKDSGVAWGYRPHHYSRDGLNTLKYDLLRIEYRPLYTWILAAVPEPVKPTAKQTKTSTATRTTEASVWGLLICWLWCALIRL